MIFWSEVVFLLRRGSQQIAEDSSKTDTSSIAESELDTVVTSRMGGGGSALYKAIWCLGKVFQCLRLPAKV